MEVTKKTKRASVQGRMAKRQLEGSCERDREESVITTVGAVFCPGGRDQSRQHPQLLTTFRANSMLISTSPIARYTLCLWTGPVAEKQVKQMNSAQLIRVLRSQLWLFLETLPAC